MPPFNIKAASVCVSTPCAHCPFRSDVEPYIRAARVEAIWQAAEHGTHFVCHETVDYALPEGHEDRGRRMCAGFLHMAKAAGLAGGLTIVQVAQRLGGLDFDNLRGGELVYGSVAAMVEAHR